MEGYHMPLALATVCLNCEEIFRLQRACPACASTHLQAVENFLTRRRGQAFEATTVRELERSGALKAWKIVGLRKEPYRVA